MGKNQAYKAMQRSRLDSSSNGAPGSADSLDDGMADGSFHSPEWHAARLANLSKTHTVTWEEFKKKQKEDELRRGEMEADKDRMMQEYRAQLDAERAKKLAQGRNQSSSKSSLEKDRNCKDDKKRRKKRRKYRSSSESSYSSSESSSDDDGRGGRKSRSRSRSKRTKKEKKHRPRSKHTNSDSEGERGPVRLSKFFGHAKT